MNEDIRMDTSELNSYYECDEDNCYESIVNKLNSGEFEKITTPTRRYFDTVFLGIFVIIEVILCAPFFWFFWLRNLFKYFSELWIFVGKSIKNTAIKDWRIIKEMFGFDPEKNFFLDLTLGKNKKDCISSKIPEIENLNYKRDYDNARIAANSSRSMSLYSDRVFIKYKEGFSILYKTSAGSACFDLIYTDKEDLFLYPGQIVYANTQIDSMLINDPLLAAQIFSRSSSVFKNGFRVVATGIIDNDYTGPIKVALESISDVLIKIKHGAAIAQIGFIEFRFPVIYDYDNAGSNKAESDFIKFQFEKRKTISKRKTSGMGKKSN